MIKYSYNRFGGVLEMLASITKFNNLFSNYYLELLTSLGAKEILSTDNSLNYKNAEYNIKKINSMVNSKEFCPFRTRNVFQILNCPNSHRDLGTKEIKSFAGIKCAIINQKDDKNQKTIIYLSGGAFIMSSTDTYQIQKSLFTIASRLDCRIITIGHDNAPEAQLNEQVEQALAAYKHILTKNIASADNIVVMGDSSGGNIASLMVNRAISNNLPAPKGMVLISPYMDTECKTLDPQIAKKDVVLGHIKREFLTGWFKENVVGKYSFRSPKVNPMYANWSKMPKTFIITGEHEILLSGIKEFVKKHKDKCELELFVGCKMIHIYPLLAEYFPEAIEGLGIVIYKLKSFFES